MKRIENYRMRLGKLFFCGFLMLNGLFTMAQDIQFSQYYAAPLYLNPAFAGTTPLARFGVNYRSQWSSIDNGYETFSAYIDNHFDEYNTSLGFIIHADRAGTTALSTTTLGLQAAYEFQVDYKWVFRPAVEFSFGFRDIDHTQFIFFDQLDEFGVANPNSQEAFGDDFGVRYPDIALGGMLYSKNIWLGVSQHHVIEPNLSFFDNEAVLPRKTSVHGGIKIPLQFGHFKERNPTGNERSLSPSFNFRSQGEFKQLDLGTQLVLAPLSGGIWYRGLPIKRNNDQDNTSQFFNNESLVLMLGIEKNKTKIGYSFDYPVSRISVRSGGAHELSIIHSFKIGDKRKPSKDKIKPKCPAPGMIF